MKLFNKDKYPYWTIGMFSVLSGLHWIYLQTLPQKDALVNFLFNVVIALFYFISGTATLLWSRGIKTDKLKMIFITLGLSLVLWSFGNFFWSYYNIIVKAEIPYPSIADFFYLLFPIGISWAFWLILDLFKFKPSRIHMKVSLIIVSVAYFLVFFIFARPTIGTDTSVLTTALNLLYPLTDAFLIALGVITFTAVGKKSIGTIILTIGLLCQAIGDLLFTYRQANGLYWNGDISDLFYLVCIIFMITGVYRMYTELISKQPDKK